jgi:predicted dehydrogenase
MKHPLGIAVVGAGYWGPNLVRNLYASDDWSVRCVVEPDAQRRERLLRIYPTVEGHHDLEPALTDPHAGASGYRCPQTRLGRKTARRAL